MITLRLINWSKVFENRGFSPITLPLAPLTLLYGFAVRLRSIAYKGVLRQKSLPGTVVSIGNLTVGGTGKTPATCMLAEWALGEGYRVAILSRGYAGKYKRKVLEVSDGNDINAGPEEGGDEPYLLARRLPGVPVIISQDRYEAGIWAHNRFGTDFFILDDGFQHLSLKRDLDLVLLDATSPFGNGHLLPWGPMREPIDQLARAHAIIITRAGDSSSGDDLSRFLEKRFPDKPLFRGDHIPEKIVFTTKNKIYSTDFLKGKRVIAFAGIATPESFRNTLIKSGTNLIHFKEFRDHHPFSMDEFRCITTEKERTGADYIRFHGHAQQHRVTAPT